MRKLSPDDPRVRWDIDPRDCLDLQTPAEAAIRAAIAEVEKVGAHPMLTETVILLGRALDTIGAYVDDVQPGTGYVCRHCGVELPRGFNSCASCADERGT